MKLNQCKRNRQLSTTRILRSHPYKLSHTHTSSTHQPLNAPSTTYTSSHSNAFSKTTPPALIKLPQQSMILKEAIPYTTSHVSSQVSFTRTYQPSHLKHTITASSSPSPRIIQVPSKLKIDTSLSSRSASMASTSASTLTNSVIPMVAIIVHALWFDVPVTHLLAWTNTNQPMTPITASPIIGVTTQSHQSYNQQANTAVHNPGMIQGFTFHTQRFLTQTKISEYTVRCGLVLIHRLKQQLSVMNAYNPIMTGLMYITTDVLLWSTCLLIAHKTLEDTCFSSAVFARLNGVTVELLNACEREVLACLKWDVGVSERDVERFLKVIGV